MGAGEVRNTMLTSVGGGEWGRRRRNEPSPHKLGHGPAAPPSDGDGRDRSGTTAAGPQMPEEEKGGGGRQQRQPTARALPLELGSVADLGGGAQGSGRRRRPEGRRRPAGKVGGTQETAAGATPGGCGAEERAHRDLSPSSGWGGCCWPRRRWRPAGAPATCGEGHRDSGDGGGSGFMRWLRAGRPRVRLGLGSGWEAAGYSSGWSGSGGAPGGSGRRRSAERDAEGSGRHRQGALRQYNLGPSSNPEEKGDGERWGGRNVVLRRRRPAGLGR
ncbi:loricrin-like [Ananas comosus]|uniref:Loricrin-like n=1 Tax=Ananas comosus TaxID=4615 RepID=A0A6P5FJB0_ANACO|nr:loricrin-like [Ananas comosus]